MAAEIQVYATGRRKESVARVWVAPGSGRILVNDKPLESYFPMKTLQTVVSQPLAVAETSGKYDVKATVEGGGIAGQAGAVRHGIARALSRADSTLRIPLKKAGFLTRDSRMKERRKYGLKKARKAPQFSKR